MKDSKISIIVPVYKVEKYLDRCVNSIVNQTYKNLEIILVDDGSPDNCPQMCDEWGKKDNRIKVIHKENGGVSEARNCGLKIATGDYIGFVDSDDYIDKTMYEKLINCMLTTNANLTMCGFVNEYENEERVIVEENLSKADSSNILNYYVLNNRYKKCNKIFLDGIMAYTCRCLYSKQILKDCYFLPNVKYCEDLLFNFSVINRDIKISTIDEHLYYYYQRNDSAIHRVDKRSIDNKLTYLDEIMPIMESKLEIEYRLLFKFSIYKIIYIDLIRSNDKDIYMEYLKLLNAKDLKSKQSYNIYRKRQKGLKNKLISSLVFHNNRSILRFLLKLKGDI